MTLTTTALMASAIILAAVGIIALYRATVGPTTQDRVVALNVVGTHAVLVIALLAAVFETHEIIDIAIVYGLLNFLLAIAIAKFSMDRGEVL